MHHYINASMHHYIITSMHHYINASLPQCIITSMHHYINASLPQCSARYRTAARQGYSEACIQLGNMYVNGEGVPTNAKVAAKHYRVAAEKNSVEGMYLLGRTLCDGGGTCLVVLCVAFFVVTCCGNMLW
jgi:TPR repeat protein